MTTSEEINAYLNTIDRMEPDIAIVDRDAALASIAISLTRIANALETPPRHTAVSDALAVPRSRRYG
jgi:hypothetical protein